MLFSRKSRPTVRRTPTFRPTVTQLEDRNVPSVTGGPATHLQVVVPENVYAGRAFEVDVKALDASNQTASGFLDTVNLALLLPLTNAGSTLPAPYTFTANDHSFHEFTVTLGTAVPSQSISAHDSTLLTVADGSAITTVLAAPLATHLFVKMEETATIGVSASVKVEALDAANHVVPNYTGVVTFTNTDAAATGVPNGFLYTFVAGDNGIHTFPVTFNTAGPQTVSAKDNAVTPNTGSAITTVSAAVDNDDDDDHEHHRHHEHHEHHDQSTAGPATHFQVTVPEIVFSGRSFQVDVQALDTSNDEASGYLGTVTLTGPGGPFTYTFTRRDHGFHEFTITPTAAGPLTLTATDTVTATIAGSAITTVKAAPLATHLLVMTPEQVAVGVPTPVTVTALDAAGHVVPEFAGTPTFLSSLGTATLKPGDPTSFVPATDMGRHTFLLIFNAAAAGTPTLTVTAGVSGTSITTVNAVGAVTHFGITITPPAGVGKPTTVTVQALDANNRVVAAYAGTVTFTNTDHLATGLPTTYTFVPGTDYGTHAFAVTFNTKGTQTVTAADTVTLPAITTSSVTVKVSSKSRHDDDDRDHGDHGDHEGHRR